MTESASLAGKLLLAMPGMGDQRFDRAVIAMCQHETGGAMGIGIGHLCDGVTLHDLLDDLDIPSGVAPDCPVHHGGPVETQRGFVLHSPEWQGEGGTLPVNEAFALSASLDILRAIAEGRGPDRWLIALGYAGWAPGQLDNEMRHHGWGTAEARSAIMFDQPAERRWAATWKAEGIDPALLSPVTGRA